MEDYTNNEDNIYFVKALHSNQVPLDLEYCTIAVNCNSVRFSRKRKDYHEFGISKFVSFNAYFYKDWIMTHFCERLKGFSNHYIVVIKIGSLRANTSTDEINGAIAYYTKLFKLHPRDEPLVFIFLPTQCDLLNETRSYYETIKAKEPVTDSEIYNSKVPYIVLVCTIMAGVSIRVYNTFFYSDF